MVVDRVRTGDHSGELPDETAAGFVLKGPGLRLHGDSFGRGRSVVRAADLLGNRNRGSVGSSEYHPLVERQYGTRKTGNLGLVLHRRFAVDLRHSDHRSDRDFRRGIERKIRRASHRNVVGIVIGRARGILFHCLPPQEELGNE